MALVNGWLELFLGLLFVGFIIVLLRAKKVTSNVKFTQTLPFFTPRYIQDWERHFSWTPVRTVDKGRVWLRYYWRSKVYSPAPAKDVDVTEIHGNIKHGYLYRNVVEVGLYI